jgi:SAM-dependent methyltransferase
MSAIVDERSRPLPADLLYGRLLATAAQPAAGDRRTPRARVRTLEPLARVRSLDGTLEPLALERWLGAPDAADLAATAIAEPPVLDLGCGPGRHLAALRDAGKRGIGVDLSPVAVRIARRRGATAIHGDVFGSVPGAGRYRTALLLDGNVGIGGAPDVLLGRTRELLAPGGTALVELDPPGHATVTTRIRLEAHGAVSEWFAWARVSVDGVAPLAARAGLECSGLLAVEERWIAVLRRP